MARPQPMQTQLCYIEPAYIEDSLISNALFSPDRTAGWQINKSFMATLQLDTIGLFVAD